MFYGIGDPKAHLRMYCDKLVGVGRDERIRMKLFMRSLTGEALSWFGFNVENAPDWFYIQKLKKKPSESFRDYAIKWRFEAARARLPMEEFQMKNYFIRVQESQYYDRMMLVVEKSFVDIIKPDPYIEMVSPPEAATEIQNGSSIGEPKIHCNQPAEDDHIRLSKMEKEIIFTYK
ncbi:hypothetical protein H5410_041326 [Solanum commersonii]|uniref:Uncharacterized protein n=1 Tax=Solanum commersonii TaxID=4109 RepID=A0A9J5XU73_SOLCO|nr:hypothetical protein H5410_041326 [Solanum commersonii]